MWLLMILKIKKQLKKTIIFPYFIKLRNIIRIIYSTKSRSRFFWNLKMGDEKLSLNYPLNKNSTCLVVGAFEGNYLNKLNSKFNCKIYAFEPVPEFYNKLEDNFKYFENIILINEGLSDKTEIVRFNINDESSSSFTTSKKSESVSMISISDFLNKYNLTDIDFIYMNIEGGEFEVLNELIKLEKIGTVKHLQIQFHKISKYSNKERRPIRKELKKTHKNIFNFPFIWERWDLI
jgi:FkbM family methyltransferase